MRKHKDTSSKSSGVFKLSVFAIILLLILNAAAFGTIASSSVPPSDDTVPILVKFTPSAKTDDVIRANGGKSVRQLSQIRTHVINVPANARDRILAAYAKNPSVERASAAVRLRLAAIPDDTEYAQQWALPKIAWDQAYDTVAISGSAKIAVLDTGVDAAHPDLANRIVAGQSFVNGSPDTDPNGHGTALAGIAAASVNNSIGIAGVAYANVSIASVQVLQADGTGWDSDVVAGVLYAADNGANVILMGFSSPDYSPALADAISYAWSKGAVLVAATGNDGSTAATYPAGMANVIGVAATDTNDNLAINSNTASALVAAPGINIYTTLSGGSYGSVSGTSASAAHVAGLAALLSANGNNNEYIYNQIRGATDPVADQSFGRINVTKALGEPVAPIPTPTATATPTPGPTPVYVAGGNPVITISVNQTSVATGSTTSFNLTIVSTGSNPIGSISISMGTVSGASWGTPSSVSFNITGWVVDSTGVGLLKVKATGSSGNNLDQGEAMNITFTVTAPSTAGTSTWTVIGYDNRLFSTTGGDKSDTKTLTMTVQAPTYIPPSPTNLVSNTGNFWVNYTWQAGASPPGNITNSYNVSVNGVWNNGTTATYKNNTVGPHGWSNITVYAFNSSGGGTLNTTPVSQNTQVPNNAPVAKDDYYSTNEDTQLTIGNAIASGVLGNDTDADDDALTPILVNNPTYGTLTLRTKGGFTYIPNLNFNGVDSFTYKANDGQADSNIATVWITVNPVNDVPAITNDSASVTVNEGQTALNSGTYSDPDVGQNVVISASVGSASKTGTNSGTWSWSYSTTDGPSQSQTVTITANDGNGGISTTTFGLTVNNVAPTATLGNDGPVNEGSPATVSFSGQSDPSSVDTAAGFHYAFACDGGSLASATYAGSGTSASTQCTFDDGPSDHTVRARIIDKDGGFTEYTTSVHVNNVAPTATFNYPASVDEGSSIGLSLASPFDPSSADTAAGFTYAFDCGDGAGYGSFSSTNSASCPTTDNGVRSVKGKIKDKDGGETEYSGSVTVNNVAPTATLGNDGPVNEGSPATVSFSGQSDPSSVDTAAGFHYAFACDGGSLASATYAGSGTSASTQCTFDDGPSDHTVRARIIDKDGGFTEYTTSVHVNNVAPTVAIINAPASSPEGTAINLGSTVSDPSTADTSAGFTYAWGVTKDGNSFASGSSSSFSFTPDDNGNYVVTFTATDKDGGIGTDSESITVTNVDPTAVINGAPASSPEGTQIDLTSTVTDPGTADTFTYAWSVTKNGAAYASGSGTGISFTPDDNGNYVVSLTVTDDDGGVGTDSKNIAVTNVAPVVINDRSSQSVQYSDPITDVLISATDVTLDPLTATTSWKKNGDPSFTSTPLLPDGLTLTTGTCTPINGVKSTCTWTLSGRAMVAPGNYTVRVTVTDEDGGLNYTDIFINVTQEDARATYTGALFTSTSSPTSSTATVTLAATIRDITAVLGDPAYDAYFGNISYAKVTFVNGITRVPLSPSCSNLVVGLVNPADPKTGTVTCDWTTNIGTADSIQYDVGIVVNGYYTRDSTADNTVVTVSKPLDNFITGGGYLVLSSPAGQKAGDIGTKNNFGFNVKYNKGGTNLQGRINTIIRRTESDGILHVYQIKGNSMTSLAVDAKITSTHPYPTAIFNGKASIQDITNPLAPISVDGNAKLQVIMTDKGEPGSSDTIAITVWNKEGGLWFASKWDGTKTVEQLLGGGNLVVH